jgi:hypothetical protein
MNCAEIEGVIPPDRYFSGPLPQIIYYLLLEAARFNTEDPFR